MDACPLLLHRACEVWSGGRVGPAVRDPGTDGPCPLARGQRPGGNQYTISCSLHFRMHPPPPPSVSPASYSPVQVTWVPEITRPSLPVTPPPFPCACHLGARDHPPLPPCHPPPLFPCAGHLGARDWPRELLCRPRCFPDTPLPALCPAIGHLGARDWPGELLRRLHHQDL